MSQQVTLSWQISIFQNEPESDAILIVVVVVYFPNCKFSKWARKWRYLDSAQLYAFGNEPDGDAILTTLYNFTLKKIISKTINKVNFLLKE